MKFTAAFVNAQDMQNVSISGEVVIYGNTVDDVHVLEGNPILGVTFTD